MYSKVKVLGKNIDIKIVDEIDNDESALGQWVGTERCIYLKKDQPCYSETLLHEILEAIKDECDLQMSHQTLATVSAILHNVLIDYPELVKE